MVSDNILTTGVGISYYLSLSYKLQGKFQKGVELFSQLEWSLLLSPPDIFDGDKGSVQLGEADDSGRAVEEGEEDPGCLCCSGVP